MSYWREREREGDDLLEREREGEREGVSNWRERGGGGGGMNG